MDSGTISLGLMAIFGLLMIAAAISDLRSRTISNELNAAIALLAIPFWIASGLALWPDMPVQFGAAFVFFGADIQQTYPRAGQIQTVARIGGTHRCILQQVCRFGFYVGPDIEHQVEATGIA